MFNTLSEEEKNNLSKELNDGAKALGSVNTLLTMIEDIKKIKPTPLVEKEQSFSFSGGSIKWNKFIYKDTFDFLINSIIREDKDGDIFYELAPRAKRNVINMLKTLKPVVISMKPKNQKTADGFSINIIDDNLKISLIFKTIFIYNIDFAKKALKWESIEKSS